MMNEDKKTQETRGQEDRFAYMNQKPDKLSNGARVAIFSLIAVVVIGVFVCLFATGHADAKSNETPSDNEVSADLTSETADREIEATKATEEPVYTEKPIDFTLYALSLHDETLIEPDSYGDYPLEPDTVYVIRWDATPLYRNREAKVNASITASSDYLIKEGGTGTISIDISDHRRDIRYSCEFSVVSMSGNLGIEFCADKCKIRAYGFWPEIEDGNFYLCFYTSGKYVESEYNGISGVDGSYHYTYGAVGSESDERSVTQPKKPQVSPQPMPEPDPKPVPMPSDESPTPDPPADPDVDSNKF